MPGLFDISAVRSSMDKHIREIGDLVTTGPEADRYAGFLSQIFAIHSITAFYYTPDEQGRYPVMDAGERRHLQEAYRQAIREGAQLLGGEETGPVGEALRSVTRELMPVLEMDSAALHAAGEEPVTLPELIADGRAQMVDFGGQPMHIVSGASSRRHHITVKNGLTTESGFFTPTTGVDPAGDYAKLIDRLEQKYPPEYRPVLEHMRRTGPAKISEGGGIIWDTDPYQDVQGGTPQARMNSMKGQWWSTFYEPLGIDAGTARELAGRPDFLAFSDELFGGVKQAVEDHRKYIEGRTYLKLQNDAVFSGLIEEIGRQSGDLARRNAMLSGHGVELEGEKRIEMRNVAMSDVADILGVPDTVLARSRPAQVLCGSEVIDGVIMNRADGVDISRMPDSHPMAQIPESKFHDVYNTEEGLKGLADLQILDYICLNVDRHAGNMLYRFNGLDTEDPRFLGPAGIDNDASFGTIVPDPKHPVNDLPPLDSVKVISEEMLEKVEDPRTRENMRKTMARNGLSEGEIQSALTRLEKVQEKVRKGEIRVVKKGEWAKGENTLEKLTGEERSLFGRFKRDVLDVMAEKRRDWDKLPEEEKVPYQEKEVSFARCMKVDGFGPDALNRKDFKALERNARDAFLQNMKTRALGAPQAEAASEKDFVEGVAQSAGEMNELLKAADPTTHLTSRTYKNLRKASSDLKKLAVKLGAKLKKPEDALGAADAEKLIRQINKLKDCAEKYDLKKRAEQARGRQMDVIEQQRIGAAADSGDRADRLLTGYDAVIRAQIAASNPMRLAHNRIQALQSGLSGLRGDELRTRVATILYYKALTSMDNEIKNDSLKNALTADAVKENREFIRNTPGFRRLCRMDDSDLRAPAAGKNADKIMDRYISEMAKEKQQEIKQDPDRKERQPGGPEAGKGPEA